MCSVTRSIYSQCLTGGDRFLTLSIASAAPVAALLDIHSSVIIKSIEYHVWVASCTGFRFRSGLVSHDSKLPVTASDVVQITPAEFFCGDKQSDRIHGAFRPDLTGFELDIGVIPTRRNNGHPEIFLGQMSDLSVGATRNTSLCQIVATVSFLVSGSSRGFSAPLVELPDPSEDRAYPTPESTESPAS
jgi:hypothetical protein